MATLLTILLYLVIIVFCLFLAFFAFLFSVVLYAQKLMLGLPWLVWLTYDDVLRMGYSGLYSRLLLPIYHKKGNVEVRARDGLSEEQQFEIKMYGFTPLTIRCYEFRLTKRPRRKIKITSLMPRSSWEPATA